MSKLKLILYSFIISIVTIQTSYAASLNLAWDANSEEDLAGYKVYYGTSTGNYGEPIDVGNITEYELSVLNEGTTYYIALTAYDNSDNESEKSDEENGVAQSPPSTTTSVVSTTTTTTAADTQAPTINITAPTSSSTYSTEDGSITIGGTASDNVGVTEVTWSNNRGGSGSASGTTSWSVSNINLQEGYNIITVTASDAAENTATDSLTVIYSPNMTVIEYYSTDPTLILTGSVPEEGFMTINVPDNLDKAISSTLLITLFDPDISGEGYIYINGTDAIDLPVGDFDNLEHSFEISTDLNQIITDQNTLRFTHVSTWGYEVRALSMKITFTSYQDEIEPTIAINQPTSESFYTTSDTTIAIGGTASDNVGVTEVTWSNNRGGSGSASGTTSWSVSNINLQEGDNIIIVTTRDAAGNTGTYTITITYTPPTTSTTSTTISSTSTTAVSTTTTPATTTTTPPEYTLTVNTVGSGNMTLYPEGGTYDEGTPVTLTAEADSGWVFSGWSGDLTGSDNPTTITMNSDKSVTATFKEDFDNDGISDEEEDIGPNGGDGNYDLTPDSEQDNVASFLTYDDQNYVTLASPDTTTLNDVQSVDNPSPTDAPAGTDFPYGFLEFIIEGVEFGGATTVTLFLPDGATPDTYYKYGPTPDNPTPHWYKFMYDGETGAEINDNVVTLYFIDGQRGDNDLTANSTIVEPGGAGEMTTQPTTTTTPPSTTTSVVSTTTTIPSDNTPPTGTISINNGEKITHSINVILTILATDYDNETFENAMTTSHGEELNNGMMTFSNDNQIWSDPEPYTTSKMWTLSPGEGDKTVFVKFRDTAGNWMVKPAKDQIRFEELDDICDNPHKLQPVSITASSESLPFWGKTRVADEKYISFWSTAPTLSWQNEFITLDLGEIKQVSRVDMYASRFLFIEFFPINFQIEISRDNLNWESIITEKSYTLKSANNNSWDMNSNEARYIRIYITKAKSFFILYLAQIAEIKVYGCDISEQDQTPYDELPIKYGVIKDDNQGESCEAVELDQELPSVPGKPVITFN